MHRGRNALLALLLATFPLGCGGDDASPAGEDPIPPPSACNGHAELCDLPYDQVVYPSTHNSMSNMDAGWAVPNQHHGLRRQLDDGIRGMLIDTHVWNDEAYLCHSVCELGHTRLVDGLGEIRAFLDENPYEIVSLLIEDYVSAEDTAKVFEAAGLSKYVFTHEPSAPWPTLREMIETRRRLVVTAQDGGPPPAWYHHLWDLAWDTPYTFEQVTDFSCELNRGSKDNDLFLINHWLGRPLATEALATEANTYEELSARAEQCMAETGRKPSFFAVDFYSIGALFQVVDELNGVASATP